MLTTYATAMSELRRRKGLLHKTEFYRLVLDEAHNIRKSKTRQYVAVSEISAARRWCITGTPIQNKVDDLGALVSFLKVPFLEDPEVFRVHITNQTYSDTSNRFDNLRKLLGCICIRRTKAIGYFSDPTVDLLYLELSHAEAQSYNDIVRRHRATLDMAVSLGDNANASQQIFKAFHELRLFCNNGTPEAKEISCIEHERIKAHRDVKACQEEDKGAHTSGEQDFHDFTNGQSSFQITSEPSHAQLVPESISGDTMHSEAIHTTILSSKLSALSKRIVGQPPGEKCIVFSFWKTSLDLVAAILRRDNIPYLRIDGSVSSAERQRALCGFDNASERMVLLMTIGTGAVGLNLASATRVHILEPQWNPMIEQQAIGRALRLGQTKKVVHVVSSQAYKLQVALKSFEKHGSDGSVPEMAKLFNVSSTNC
ncbi:helicase [Penicillium sp. CMV-2018d]|nr:helicase [Penicillium sp. CMV-2018d]